jgi:hypothetical protein
MAAAMTSCGIFIASPRVRSGQHTDDGDNYPDHCHEDAYPDNYPYVLEASGTIDSTWNNLQAHLRLRGYLEPSTALYWGQRVLEWSPNIDAGMDVMLNDFHDSYMLTSFKSTILDIRCTSSYRFQNIML